MVTRLLKLDSTPQPADAADALALAICHLWRAPMRDRLARAERQAAELAAKHKARLAAARQAQQQTQQQTQQWRAQGDKGRGRT
jgi:crossover junction endodeoxyribonuclease RuvC